MKKALFTLALAAFAFAANAQLIIGGNIGINGTTNNNVTTNTIGGTTTTTEIAGPKTMNFYIAPKIGYQLNEKMSLGIILGFDRQNITRDSWGPVDPTLWGATNYVGTRKMSYNTITITPYFRYNAMKLNNLTLFCEASIPVSIKTADKIVVNEEGDVAGTHVTATTTTIDNKVTSFGLTITPGFNYALNEHLSLDMYLNAINLGFIMSKTKTSADSFENNVSVDTDINWGLNIHTLPTAAVSFGINYAF